MDYEDLLGIGIIGLGLMVIMGAILIALAIVYVLNSLVLMKVFKILDYEKPAYAWIPFYNAYILASEISDGLKNVHVLLVDIPVDVYKWLWLIVSVACSTVSNFIPYVGPLLSIAISVIYYGDLYARVYALITGNKVEDETGLGIASAFIHLIYYIRVLMHSIDGTERVKFRETDELIYREVDNDFTK